MSNLFEVISKIEKLNFDYLISDQQIVSDEGVYNVPLENSENVRYLFSDSNEFGNRSELEIKKIKMLNESLEIIFDMYAFARQHDPNYYPYMMGADPREQYEQEAILDDAPPDGVQPDGVQPDGDDVDGDSCDDSEMTIDIEVEDLADTMNDVEL
jgi:hypothetical protein